MVAEVACVLTVSERSASALLSDAQVLTTALPLTLDALQAGTISWQHARIMVDETASLDPAGAAGLEAHFLDPDVPDPARGCRAGDLVPSRFRAKARTWRERHHPVSIEARHARCAADRRIEFVPDRDGMAWLNAYLPADTAAGIWERTTAAARALQGPDEARTLTQLRADIAATWLLTAGLDDGGTAGGRAGRDFRRNRIPRHRPSGGQRRRHRNGRDRGPTAPRRRRRSGRVSGRGCAVAAGAGPRHRPGAVPAGRHRRTRCAGRVRADPAVDGPPAGRRRRRFRLPGPDRPPRRGAVGDRPAPATGSRRPCGNGSGSATASARSRAAATRRWTTRQTTSWPGPTAAPPASPTWDSPAANTTTSNTDPPGPPPRPAKTNRRHGSHHPAGPTPANTRTGNHPTGRTSSCP